MDQLQRPQLTAKQFHEALGALDAEIAKSKNLKKASPIRLLSAGGYVAVAFFHNRETTEDIDFIIDPDTKNVAKVREKLQQAISKVADLRGITEEWINSRMEVFAVGDVNKRLLFNESVSQGAIIWQGKNLVIYAAKWEWALARKVKRIGSQNRDIDKSDAVALLSRMVQENGGPLTYELIKSWDEIVYTRLDDAAIKMVAELFIARFGNIGAIPSSRLSLQYS